MALRHFHKGWKLFWEVIFAILFIVVILVGGAFLILQLDATEDTIVQNIENAFRQNYKGELIIGDLDGTLPFNAVLKDVKLVINVDSTRTDTVASIARVKLSVDLWALFQSKISINAFGLQQPSVRLFADGSDSYTFLNALQKEQPTPDAGQSLLNAWITRVEIIAPVVTIDDGSVFIEKFYDDVKNVDMPEPFRVDSINARMYVELTELHRFFDVETFTARVKNTETEQFTFSGQLYNDGEALEFNALHLTAGRSHLHFNGTIAGVDLYRGDIREQLKEAVYDLEIGSHRLLLAEFNDIFTSIPDISEPVQFTIEMDGSLNALKLTTLSLGTGDSYLSIDGRLNNLFNQNELAYAFNIDTLEVYRRDLENFPINWNEPLFQALQNLRLAGQASGSSDSLALNISAQSSLGQLTFNGFTQLIEPYNYRGDFTGRGIDIAPIVKGDIDTTFLNIKAHLAGRNTSLTQGQLILEGLARNSFVNHISIDSLEITASLNSGLLDAEYFYRSGEQIIAGKAGADFNKQDDIITMAGETEHLDLPGLFGNMPVDSTSLNMAYQIKLQGLKPDRIHGTAQLKVEPSLIGADSVVAHQIEARLSPPNENMRTFVVNSSLFDMRITGDIQPQNISRLYRYWSNYFGRRITDEILLDSVSVASAVDTSAVKPLQLKGRITAKNLNIVRNYWPAFPSIETNGQLQFSVEAGPAALQFSSNVQSDTLTVNQIQFKNAVAALNGSFQHNKTLKQYSNLELTSRAAKLQSDLFEMDSLSMEFQFHQDSLFLTQQISQFSDSARYNLQLRGLLTDSTLTAVVDNFFLGNPQYAWQESDTPRVTFTHNDEIRFNSFRFRNKKSTIALIGLASPNPQDSLTYILRDVDLGRISSLLRNRINFDGTLNATLQTSTLSLQPLVQGELTVNRLTIQDQLMGDAWFTSDYQPGKKQFDMRLEIVTDSVKYAEYLASNGNISQNIMVDGYYIPPDLAAGRDTTFYFDADFNQLSAWILPVILDDIFRQTEGAVSGNGYLAGNAENVEFHAEFMLDRMYAQPAFLQTNYYLTGQVRLDSQNGVIVNYVNVEGDDGGTGTLWGQIDLNDFRPIKHLDLHFRLNDLKFLDNNYEPGIPFYGSVAGTGDIHLVGPTTDMRLITTEDIIVSQNSRFSLPLTEGTQVSDTRDFIEFVDSFENPEQALQNISGQQLPEAGASEEALERAIDELTFSDKMDIDLQFRAPQPITTRLIFDAVTGEKLIAEGTGYMRIIMQSDELQMFGRFDVTGGTYQFVSGQIFSRELEIRQGGFIAWNGPPEEANLNIEAVYHARPTTESLTVGSVDDVSQRVPVDLVVEISGSLDDIVNNYYFELPGYIAANATIQYRINQINSTEEQKLYQATSILLTGEFLPIQSEGVSLRRRLSESSTYLNPLISNQIVSPILSNQINSLLNSDVAELDIDFRLNTYNQIDLGVALRLYNDKLILQRQGRLTGGPASDDFIEQLGNLSASYRITPNLSVQAFHRQVPTLGAFSNDPVIDVQPSVNGLGLEVQVQFNTWQHLLYKIGRIFLNTSEPDEENTENENAVGSKQQQ